VALNTIPYHFYFWRHRKYRSMSTAALMIQAMPSGTHEKQLWHPYTGTSPATTSIPTTGGSTTYFEVSKSLSRNPWFYIERKAPDLWNTASSEVAR